MKTRFLIAFISFSLALQAQSILNQNISINDTGAAPNTSARLDVSATDKGILIPRLTTVQRTAIATPANGLLVFDTDTRDFWFYDAAEAAWKKVRSGVLSSLEDTDGDTGIQAEESPDEDVIRFDLGGTEHFVWKAGRMEIFNSGRSVFIGRGAGASDDYSNNRNVAVGDSTLASNTSGTLNTAGGFRALFSNTTGQENAAFGNFTLAENTTGSENTASGRDALRNNSTGSRNTGMGAASLFSNTTGSTNSALGFGALALNTAGKANVALGVHALYSSPDLSFIVAVGDSALYNNGTSVSQPFEAKKNTAIGSKALFSNTTGYDNTATGFNALFNNTIGQENTANGNEALYMNTTGERNTATGHQTLYFNSTGFRNSAYGYNALYNNLTGSNNTASGNGSLYLNTSGSDNTAFGWSALSTNTSGSGNTAIGYNANISPGDLDNATAIGYNSIVNCSNCMVLGGTGGGAVNVGIGTSAPLERLHVVGNICYTGSSGACSDIRYKRDFQPIANAMTRLHQISGWYYYWKTAEYPEKEFETSRQIGLIAQEVEQQFPEMVLTDAEGYKSVDYSRLTPVLLEAMKEQQLQIENLESRILELEKIKSENDEMKERMARIEAALAGNEQ